ncbi:MAG: response regulator, partial [Thermodesulfovibrionales bacterium]
MQMQNKLIDSILVVDDDETALDVTVSLLEETGYSVIPCSDGIEAINKIKEENVDVVLSDIRMPNISGIDLLKKINDYNSDVPVILMTGYADLDIAIEAIKRGAYDFITKPYQLESLQHSIERAVRYYSLVKKEKRYKDLL